MYQRHGKTPAAFLLICGCFDVPVNAAHCVWVDDADIDLMADKHVTAVYNPVSNLKLGSGVMPMKKLLEKGYVLRLVPTEPLRTILLTFLRRCISERFFKRVSAEIRRELKRAI